MSMTCLGCGNKDAYHVTTRFYEGQKDERCDRCGAIGDGSALLPDVYFSGRSQTFEALCDEMGRPYEITSKRQKKEVMKRLGVSEVGDRVNGAPFGSKNWVEGTRDARRRGFEADRPKIREIYKRYLERAR